MTISSSPPRPTSVSSNAAAQAPAYHDATTEAMPLRRSSGMPAALNVDSNRTPWLVAVRVLAMIATAILSLVGVAGLLFLVGNWLVVTVFPYQPLSHLPQQRPGQHLVDATQTLHRDQQEQLLGRLVPLDQRLLGEGWVVVVSKLPAKYDDERALVAELFDRWHIGQTAMGARGYLMLVAKRPHGAARLWLGQGFCAMQPFYAQQACYQAGAFHPQPLTSSRWVGPNDKLARRANGVYPAVDHALRRLQDALGSM